MHTMAGEIESITWSTITLHELTGWQYDPDGDVPDVGRPTATIHLPTYTYEPDNVPEPTRLAGSIRFLPSLAAAMMCATTGLCAGSPTNTRGDRTAQFSRRERDGALAMTPKRADGLANRSAGTVTTSSTIANFDTTYTEYRGDGPTRRFVYTDLHLTRSRSRTGRLPTWLQWSGSSAVPP